MEFLFGGLLILFAVLAVGWLLVWWVYHLRSALRMSRRGPLSGQVVGRRQERYATPEGYASHYVHTVHVEGIPAPVEIRGRRRSVGDSTSVYFDERNGEAIFAGRFGNRRLWMTVLPPAFVLGVVALGFLR